MLVKKQILLAFRNSDTTPTSLTELAERIFTLVIMGDDRAVRATYIMGKIAEFHV
jgi:guanine deaminase